MGNDVLYLEQAYQWVVGGCYFLFEVLHTSPSFHRHFHVRLAAAKPDFARHDILQDGLLSVIERQRVRPSGLGNREVEAESPRLSVGLRLAGLAVP